jgi:lipid-A-disaccharide synthase
VYKTSAITYWIAKRLVRIPHIGLLNVVAGREVAPEFVQEAFTTTAVADALTPLFGADSVARRTMLDGMADIRRMLGTPGAAGRVAEMAAAMVDVGPAERRGA